MTNMKSNVGSFAAEKLQVKMRSILAIIALTAVIGFSLIACGNDETTSDVDSEETVSFTMQFKQNDGWNESGHNDWARWIYDYKDENNSFDLSTMLKSPKKVYIFNYSFTSDTDIDYFNLFFWNSDPDSNGGWRWKAISDYAFIASKIEKNKKYSGKVALIPQSNAAGLLPENTQVQFGVKNRDVNTATTLSFYEFSFEQVNKEEGLTKWTIGDKEFAIDAKTYAKQETFDGKSTLHIRPSYNVGQYGDQVMYYDLSSYAGKTIELVMSVDVYLTKPARIAWQIDSSSPYYPVVAGTVEPDSRFPYHSGPKLSANKWHTISGSNIITVPSSGDNGKKLYLSGMQIDGAEAYFANPRSTTTQGSGGNTNVTLNTVTVDGTPTNKLILNFSGLITGLTADNIVLSGDVAGVIKGALSNSGSTYTLLISGFTAGGKLMVWVSKLGYTISGSSKEVTIIGSGGGGGGGANPFIGTWKDADLTVVCTATTWKATVPGYQTWQGNYTPNGNTANFIETNGNNFGTATISGNNMTVNSTYGNYYLTKQ